MEWVAKRYDIEIATREEKWLKQYPLLGNRIVQLEKEVIKLKDVFNTDFSEDVKLFENCDGFTET